MTAHDEPGVAPRGAGPPSTAPERETRRPTRFVALLVVCCLGLAAIDGGLVLRNRELQAQVAELHRALGERGLPPLVVGADFPPVALLDELGRPVELTGVAELTLLFVSSPSCGACEDVRPLWDEVAPMADGERLRVVELVLDAAPETLLARAAAWLLVVPGGDSWSLVGRIPGVPASIVVDAAGRVRRTFYGDEHAGLRAALEELLLGG